MKKPRVLLVTAEEELVEEAREMLEEEHGAEVSYAKSQKEAEQVIEDQELDFVVIGEEIKGGSPIDLFNHILQQHPSLNTVILAQDIDTEEMERRPEKVIPYDPDKLEMALDVLADTIETSMEMEVGTTYPQPENEEERLKVLEKFDIGKLCGQEFHTDLTEKGAEIFDVPMCYIGLIERDKEQFLTCHGADFNPIDREDAVCSYAIIEDGVMVVDDVQNDQRFCDVESLQELGIRFYASAPITIEGQRIGTFCIADKEKRDFSEEDKEKLRELADEFAEELEEHKEAGD